MNLSYLSSTCKDLYNKSSVYDVPDLLRFVKTSQCLVNLFWRFCFIIPTYSRSSVYAVLWLLCDLPLIYQESLLPSFWRTALGVKVRNCSLSFFSFYLYCKMVYVLFYQECVSVSEWYRYLLCRVCKWSKYLLGSVCDIGIHYVYYVSDISIHYV